MYVRISRYVTVHSCPVVRNGKKFVAVHTVRVIQYFRHTDIVKCCYGNAHELKIWFSILLRYQRVDTSTSLIRYRFKQKLL